LRNKPKGDEVSENQLSRLYEQLLENTFIRTRKIEIDGHLVNVMETGNGGPILVLLHGTGSYSPFFLPLLKHLKGIRTICPDRPGQGLSEPIDLHPERYREIAVDWVNRLLDSIKQKTVALLGHSMGGLWALWYALACPNRVKRLVLIGPPQLPGTRTPFPYRLMATPGLGELLQKLAPPSPRSVLQFASFMGEHESISRHPEIIELLVASGRNPVTARTDLAEGRTIISPLALISRSGFRKRMRVRHEELQKLSIPTLLIWGKNEPLGNAKVANEVSELIPHCQLEIIPGGHAPWLGHSHQTAKLITTFVSG
jgi:pimeloyl-ACP methyl ester carboxylesterase